LRCLIKSGVLVRLVIEEGCPPRVGPASKSCSSRMQNVQLASMGCLNALSEHRGIHRDLRESGARRPAEDLGRLDQKIVVLQSPDLLGDAKGISLSISLCPHALLFVFAAKSPKGILRTADDELKNVAKQIVPLRRLEEGGSEQIPQAERVRQVQRLA